MLSATTLYFERWLPLSQNFYKFYIKISAFIIVFFCLVLTLRTMLPTSEPARLGLDILSWPINGFPSFQGPDIRFLSALTGGFLVGWGVIVLLLSTLVYDKAPEEVRKALVYSTLAWFVFDSTGSIASGNPVNAIFNFFVLLLVIGPLWVPAKNSRLN